MSPRHLVLAAASVVLVASLVPSPAQPFLPGGDPRPDSPKKYDIPALRKKLAYVSLADRLAYEKEHRERRVPGPRGGDEFGNWRAEDGESPLFGQWALSRVRGYGL